jgi:hypothetical protein
MTRPSGGAGRRAPDLFAIDNLDQALNPRMMARLAARLAEWLKVGGSQLLFTAHNPAVLVTLSEELLKLNKEYPLSRLWMMGHLGAVPNV